jgi:hypothetical protein
MSFVLDLNLIFGVLFLKIPIPSFQFAHQELSVCSGIAFCHSGDQQEPQSFTKRVTGI